MSLRSMSEDGDEDGGLRQMFTDVGTYRGIVVAILRVDKARVELTKADMKELKAVCVLT